jgi:hypothetical protein
VWNGVATRSGDVVEANAYSADYLRHHLPQGKLMENALVPRMVFVEPSGVFDRCFLRVSSLSCYAWTFWTLSLSCSPSLTSTDATFSLKIEPLERSV